MAGQTMPAAFFGHGNPMNALAGLAGAAGHGAEVLVNGYAYGSLSMTAYTLDAHVPGSLATPDDAAPAPGLPDPSVVPPDDTNI